MLAKHDAIATGNPLPIQRAGSSTPPGEVLPDEANSNFNQTDVRSPSHQTDTKSPSRSPVESISTPKASPPAPLYSQTSGLSDEEEEDEFAQLARRSARTNHLDLYFNWHGFWKVNFLPCCNCDVKIGSMSVI